MKATVTSVAWLQGFLFLVVVDLTLTAQSYSTRRLSFPAKPSATQAKWLDLEVGAVIHFNMQTFNRNMKRGKIASPDTFNPRDLSTDQWVGAASSFGAKFVVLTLDHFSGFLLWPSGTYSYSVKSTKWRGGKADIASDLIQSCKKEKLKHGYFYSVNKNWFMNVENYKTKNPGDQQRYNQIVLQQLTELLGKGSKYAKPFYFWFDAGTDTDANPNIGPLIRALANETICDECKSFSGPQGLRWVGNENAVAPLPNWYSVAKGKCINDPGDPRGEQFCPASCDTVIREHYWFWEPNTDHRVKTPQRLLQEYLTSVGRGCNLILNLNPDNRGLVPDKDLQVYRALGEGVKLLYKYPIVTRAKPELQVQQTLKIKLPKKLNIVNGSVVIMEDITSFGQLTKSYIVKYKTEQGVVEVEGSSIGHKRIHPFPIGLRGLMLESVELTIVRLITEDRKIRLKEISIYDWTEAVQKGFLDQDKMFYDSSDIWRG